MPPYARKNIHWRIIGVGHCGEEDIRLLQNFIIIKQVVVSSYDCSASQSLDVRKHGETIRAHWTIENKLHYVLDVFFDEAPSRSRKDHLVRNFTTIRKVCMNLLRSAKADKKTLKSTARKALMFPEFAFDLIRKPGILAIGSLA